MEVVCLQNPNVVLEEALEGQCNERFNANFRLFERVAPQLAKAFSSLPSLNSDLVPVGDDDWDIHFRGIPLYNRGGRATAEAQVDAWEASPVRIRVLHPSRSQFDEHSGLFFNEVDGAVHREKIVIEDDILDPRSFHFVCFGIGLGFHLVRLFERMKPKNIFIFETNIEFLYQSLRVFDWSQIFDPQKYPGAKIQFITVIDLHKAPIALREGIRSGNPCLVDGTAIFQHYPNDQYNLVIGDALKNAALTMSGLGFLDDEVRMVRNAYLNHRNPAPLVFRPQNVQRDWPLFLVGSGPSLDSAIGDIKRNAERAVIVSCGTSLPALLRNGIRPDLFVVLENGPEIFDYITVAKKTWGLDGVTLLASSTVDPRVPALFDHSVLYLRPGLASYPLFGLEPWMCLNNGHPTVTNTGFSSSIAFGYKEIYLFGIDLGSRVPERHHSSASPYMADGMEFDDPLTQTVPGNLGGLVYTSYVFNWSRDVFEQTIAVCRRPLRVINTSDGAFIARTQPRLSRTLNLPEQTTSKAEELASLWGELAPYGAERFAAAWSRERLIQQSEDLCAALQGALAEVSTGREAIIGMMRLLGVHETFPAHHFIRGSLMQQMILSNYYLNRVVAEDAARLDAIVIELLSQQVDLFTEHVVRFISDLDDGKTKGDWLRTPQGEPSEW